MDQVKHRLSILMSQPDAKLDTLASELTQLLDARCREAGSSALVGTSDEALVSSMVGRVFSVDDPMYQFTLKKVGAAAAAALLGAEDKALTALLLPANADLLLPHLRAVCAEIAPVVALNISVYTPIYTAIIQAVSGEA